jgi:hypothetical protein
MDGEVINVQIINRIWNAISFCRLLSPFCAYAEALAQALGDLGAECIKDGEEINVRIYELLTVSEMKFHLVGG